MTETTNRRRDDRVPIRLEAFCSFGRIDGVGVLADISYSGARIEDITMRPQVGTFVVLNVYRKSSSYFEAMTPFTLAGSVVRHSSTGFALEYKDNVDPDVRRMVDDAAAIVAVPRGGPPPQ